ncbi:hypothetical protein OAD26_00555, partial [bacterium]|nr:hypothetical protein [bacterium]
MNSGDRHIEIDTERGKILKLKAEEYSERVKGIIEGVDLDEHEASLAIACVEEHQHEIQSKIEHLKNAKHVILIGIGGSTLGTEAVYAGLGIRTNPKLYVFDSVDEEALKNISTITRQIECDADLAVVVASKSGATTETITNAAGVLEELEKRFGKGI